METTILFPVVYARSEGLRRDVQVVNLSLLNTGWYVREPKIDIKISDEYIDSVLTDTQMVDLYHRLWRDKSTNRIQKIRLRRGGQPINHDLLRIQI